MVNTTSNPLNLRSPRSFQVLLFQLIAILPFSLAFLLLGIIICRTKLDLLTISTLSFVILLLMSLGYAIYVAQIKHIPVITINKAENSLVISSTGKIIQLHELSSIRRFISRRYLSKREYTLTIESIDDKNINVFQEVTFHGGTHWQKFAQNLSAMSEIPLLTEIILENNDSNNEIITSDALNKARKKGIVSLLTPIAISIIGAFLYSKSRFIGNLWIIGLLTIACNMTIYILFIRKYDRTTDNREKIAKYIAALSLFIPYLLYYLLFVFIICGFRLPTP